MELTQDEDRGCVRNQEADEAEQTRVGWSRWSGMNGSGINTAMHTETLSQVATLWLRRLEEQAFILFVGKRDRCILASQWSTVDVHSTFEIGGSVILLSHHEQTTC